MSAARDVVLYSKIMETSPLGFAEALADAGLGIFFADWQTQEIDYNSVLRTEFGLPEQGNIPREYGFQNLVHPDDVDEMRRRADENVPEGRPYMLHHRMRRASGRYFPCITHINPVLDAEGDVAHLIGVMRDQDALERSIARMDRAERLAGFGNWSVELPSRALSWSDGVYAIYGYDRGDFKPDLDVVREHYIGPDIERVAQIIEEALAEGTDFEYQARINTKMGDEKHIRVVGEVEFGPDGKPVAYSGVMQDITEEILRETQIRQSQKIEAIGKMTGGAAHDFNNLLAVILGNLELIRDQIDQPELVEHCESAISATMSGAALTRNMLSFARRARLEPQTLDINDAVRGLERWARRTLPATIEAEVSLMAGLWKSDLDRGSLESALLNLILNARDAMPEGGKLTIETANVRIDDEYIESREEDIDPGRYVMLAVSDTGSGIPKEEFQRIFEPFFTTKAVGEGSGLGLSMVQGFVKQSAGAIRVYSEPGEGTTFKLYFRARHEPRMDVSRRVQRGSEAVLAGKRILLAEDELDVQQVIAMTLRRAGYEVQTANSGDEAMVAFQADPSFDLLLTDIVMPGRLQGTGLARELRKLQPELPVVFMSGYANEATVHGNGLRPDDTRLMKPVRKATLLEAIRKALSAVGSDD